MQQQLYEKHPSMWEGFLSFSFSFSFFLFQDVLLPHVLISVFWVSTNM